MTGCLSKFSLRLFIFCILYCSPGLGSTETVRSSADVPVSFLVLTATVIIIAALVILIALYTLFLLNTFLLNERRRRMGRVVASNIHEYSLWTRILHALTRSTPVREEESILLDHNYDGIRELDNHLPPWWKGLFYLTIIWAGLYLLVYHVFDFLPLSDTEYQFEIAKAKAENENRVSLQTEGIDEHNVEFSDQPEVLLNGASVFKTNCAVCHAEDGGGGVGPNLTDPYWIHGGSVKNIFWVIKYGIPSKGMISWKNQLSPVDMRDVASYIMTLKDTSPANPKEPQGAIYNEEIVVENIDSGPDLRPVLQDVTDSLDSVQIGRGLFSGPVRLVNNGPGCITCHHVTEDILPKGALVAPDLTNVYTRLGEATIIKYATQPYHAVMQAAYQGRPVLEEEAKYLAAFFRFVGTATAHQQQRDQRAAGFLNRIKKK